MSLEPQDTAPLARSIQAQAHLRLGPEGRLQIALELSEAVRDIRLAGLRSVSPDASEAELVRMFISEAHGLHLPALP